MSRFFGVLLFSGIYLTLSTPAMAQSEGGIEGPPEDIRFVAPAEMDAGVGCSRQRPRECTPEQRERYNELVGTLCAGGSAVVGGLDGILVTWLVGATVAGAPAAPGAGIVHGGVVTAAVYQACVDRFKIPAV